MKYLLPISTTLLFIFSSVSCTKQGINGNFVFPETITIKEINLVGLRELSPQGVPWDPDGFTPDVFIQVLVNREQLLFLRSDTITVDTNWPDLPFRISEEIVLTPEDTSVIIRVFDYDYDPNLPPVLQFNDDLGRVYVDPWNLSSPFRLINVDRNPVSIRNSNRTWLGFEVEYN
jgi:hypothetical protein